MKANTLLPALLLVFCAACNNNPQIKTEAQKDVPKPLQDNSADFASIKSSRGVNMVDDIYADQVTKQPELQKLEDLIRHFNDDSSDNLEQFAGYQRKSSSYYGSANELLGNIKDTVLRAQLNEMLVKSQHKYKDTIRHFSVLINHIDSNKIKIENYHLALKLAVTLPIIEHYQFESLPDLKSTANLANEAQRLKVKTMQMAKKQQDRVR